MTLEEINAQVCDRSPIQCLPNEILEVIFLINTSNSIRYDSYYTTLATSQVCQRWRTVAFNYPVIWSRIINYEWHSPRLIETLLARSGSSLIDVGVDSESPFRVRVTPPCQCRTLDMRVLKSIFQRTASLRTAALNIHRANWKPVRSFFEHPAPNLEFLNLSISSPGRSPAFPSFLSPLFADEAPCLRRLQLEGCFIDFFSSVLSNLTQLSVREPVMTTLTYSHPATLSVAEWLRVLKNMPALRFLTLSEAFIFPMTEQEPHPIVDLPHLALLRIKSRFHIVTSIISTSLLHVESRSR